MGEVVIAARGLCKSFAVYARPRDMLLELVTGRTRHRLFDAIRDVTFEVAAGEVLGVMGRNGAGKSTLLKLVAGTLEPTRGTVSVDGRIAAILELGTGFHPQYTGRENVIMGGMCLGMSEREVRRKFDAIVDFAELREFIDQPFRTYSTGMQTRLSFATAVALEPRILIVDEALSVGDARFQLKCHDRFQEFRREGRTILLVSHSSEQIATICDRAIVLERGELIEDGPANEVTRRYHRLLFGGGGRNEAPNGNVPGVEGAGRDGAGPLDAGDEPHGGGTAGAESDLAGPPSPELDAGTRMGNGEATIHRIAILDDAGADVRRMEPGEPYRLRFAAIDRVGHAELAGGFLIRDRTGQTIFGLDTRFDGAEFFSTRTDEVFWIELRMECHLGPGEYFLSFGVALPDGTKLDYCYDAVGFSVGRRRGVYHASRVDLNAILTVRRSDVRRAEPD